MPPRSGFQSTHPHGVRLERIAGLGNNTEISIHAPARGATCHQHIGPFSLSDFNPRTRTGCDVIARCRMVLLSISIHAPARGATLNYVQFAELQAFQSTHPHGVRLQILIYMHFALKPNIPINFRIDEIFFPDLIFFFRINSL